MRIHVYKHAPIYHGINTEKVDRFLAPTPTMTDDAIMASSSYSREFVIYLIVPLVQLSGLIPFVQSENGCCWQLCEGACYWEWLKRREGEEHKETVRGSGVQHLILVF